MAGAARRAGEATGRSDAGPMTGADPTNVPAGRRTWRPGWISHNVDTSTAGERRSASNGDATSGAGSSPEERREHRLVVAIVVVARRHWSRPLPWRFPWAPTWIRPPRHRRPPAADHRPDRRPPPRRRPPGARPPRSVPPRGGIRSEPTTSGSEPTTSGAGSTTPSAAPAVGAPVLSSLSPPSATAGQQVVIAGGNFMSANGHIVAHFGIQVAATDCPEQTSCTATVPSFGGSATTVPVTITTASGTSDALTFGYEPAGSPSGSTGPTAPHRGSSGREIDAAADRSSRRGPRAPCRSPPRGLTANPLLTSQPLMEGSGHPPVSVSKFHHAHPQRRVTASWECSTTTSRPSHAGPWTTTCRRRNGTAPMRRGDWPCRRRAPRNASSACSNDGVIPADSPRSRP